MFKECYLCVSEYSQKKGHLSVRLCNGDVIIVCRIETEFFNITSMKFDFKWLTFENIPVTAAHWLLV